MATAKSTAPRPLAPRRPEITTAYHEAGHAIVAWGVGARLHRATIDPGADYLGKVMHARTLKAGTWYANDDRAQLLIAREIKICFAGALAVKRAFPGSCWRSGAEGDYHHAADLILHVYMDQRDQFLWSSLLARATERLLERYWYAVEAVAAALSTRRTLSGPQIKCIIIDAGNASFGMRSGEPGRATVPAA